MVNGAMVSLAHSLALSLKIQLLLSCVKIWDHVGVTLKGRA